MLPELATEPETPAFSDDQAYSSADYLLDLAGVRETLERNGFLFDQSARGGLELVPA